VKAAWLPGCLAGWLAGWRARARKRTNTPVPQGSNGLKERRREETNRGRRRSANVPIHMFFVFFVSRLVCSTARRKEGVPDEREGRPGGGPDGAGGGL